MVPKNHIGWFVIITRWGQWKKIAERLTALNVGHFIPRTYNTLVFLHTDKTRALNLVNSGEIKGRFLVDHGTRTLLEVPDKQMDAFIELLKKYYDYIILDFPPATIVSDAASSAARLTL